MKKGIWFTNLAPTLCRMRIDKTSIPIVLRLSQGRPFLQDEQLQTSLTSVIVPSVSIENFSRTLCETYHWFTVNQIGRFRLMSNL